MRFCRIEDGDYSIAIYENPDGDGRPGKLMWEDEKSLKRFDIVNLPISSHKPVLIKVQQINRIERPKSLPDLAIDLWDAVYDHETISCVIHNLGNAGQLKM
jgi:hypothetical protein